MKEKIIIIIITSLITGVVGIALLAFTERESKIGNAASEEYVNTTKKEIEEKFSEKDKEIIQAFRKGDSQTKEYCKEKDEVLQKCIDSKVGKDEFKAFSEQLNTIHLYILNNKNK